MTIPLENGYRLEERTPSPEDYCRLRAAAGLSPKSVEAARRGLPGTFYGVVAVRGGEVVGMGRVVGDGALFLQIVDIAVLPEHQGRGIGKAIVRALVEHIRRAAPPGTHVSLLADGPAKHLYAQFGFRETGPVTVGMAFKV